MVSRNKTATQNKNHPTHPNCAVVDMPSVLLSLNTEKAEAGSYFAARFWQRCSRVGAGS